jgi:hypothetical protein
MISQKTRLLAIIFNLYAVVLIACAAPAAAPAAPAQPAFPVQTEQPSGAQPVEPKPLEVPEGNCVVYPNGQYGWRKSGELLGYRSHGRDVFQELQELITKRAKINGVEEPAAKPVSDAKVVILVVDEFEAESSPDVSKTIKDLFGNEAEFQPDSLGKDASQWMRDIEEWQIDNDGNTITLVGIDTDAFTTEVLADRINRAISLLRRKFGTSRVVLNMSFGIVPCDERFAAKNLGDLLNAYLELIQSSQDPSLLAFEALLKGAVEELAKDPAKEMAILTEPTYQDIWAKTVPAVTKLQIEKAYPLFSKPGDDSVISWIDGRISGQPDADPLFAKLQELQSEEQQKNDFFMTNVAAAGNLGWWFPLAPGVWRGVLSVSALQSKDKDETRLVGSNSGEVGTPEYVWPGTSFTAPQVSLQAALHYVQGGGVKCEGNKNPGNPFAPPMKYVLPQVNPDWYQSGHTWMDLNLETASKDYCTGFPTL